MVYFRFPQMTSFHRMLVHRAASYFGMDHNLDSSGSCVVVSRNRNSRLPERNFLQIMRDVKGLHGRAYSSEEPRKSILKRDFASFEDNHLKVCNACFSDHARENIRANYLNIQKLQHTLIPKFKYCFVILSHFLLTYFDTVFCKFCR